MSEVSAEPIFLQLKRELLGGKVVDIGVYQDARQPYLCMLVIENEDGRFEITFDRAPKINGGY
jgi:hypothetical protein